MAKSFNYKKLYKEYFEIGYGKGFDIHHIDRNREHNDINNLILLPSWLHKEFHNTINSIYNVETIHTSVLNDVYLAERVVHYGNVVQELIRWMSFKRQLEIFRECGLRADERPKEIFPDGVYSSARK